MKTVENKSSKMLLISRQNVSNSSKSSQFKRSRSIRASTRLMSKFRSRVDTFNANIENRHILKQNSCLLMEEKLTDSNTSLNNIAEDLITKLSLTNSEKIVKTKHEFNTAEHIQDNNKNISNSTVKYVNQNDVPMQGYENPSFSFDTSLNTSVTNYLFNESFDEKTEAEINRQNNRSIIKKSESNFEKMKFDDKLTIIFGQCGESKNSVWSGRNSRKNNTDKVKANTSYMSWFGNKEMNFRRKNKAEESNIQVQSFIDNYQNTVNPSTKDKLAEVDGLRFPDVDTMSLLKATTTNTNFSVAYNNLTECRGNAEDKQVSLCERKVRTLRKIMLAFDQARPPDVPCLVGADIIGVESINIKIQTEELLDPSVCTKFKVQWSTKEDFSVITGEREILDIKQKECRIDGLVHGQRYYFRVCLGNSKGYSGYVHSVPASLAPSSWRDIIGGPSRFDGRFEQLHSLFVNIHRPEYAQDTSAAQRRNHKKKTTIKQLFTATSKFQKNLKRGVYFACLLYYEDKVLVTNDDFIPVIQVDETYPSCINSDFHWLMKVACTWENVKILRQDMERSHSSSTNHFRLKLLQAAVQMQTALGIQDLGQIYHKTIRDIQGTLAITTVNLIECPKLVPMLNGRWVPFNKLVKKINYHEASNVADMLISSIQDQITYHKLSTMKLSKGLYLGYLKMQSSVDQIQVVVPSETPNVLPYCKIRDNPLVSAEEWNFLKIITRFLNTSNFDYHSNTEEKENTINIINRSEQGNLFVDLLANAIHCLFSYMNINSEDALLHRLYDVEVIELSQEVSFLIVVPPFETACVAPGNCEILLQRQDFLILPIQVFEMVHLNAYQKNILNCYSRLNCILELETAQAQQNHREAFSSSEVIATKDKLSKLQDLQSQVNNVWKGARWLIDIITFARDRGTSQSVSSGTTGTFMKYLLSIMQNNRISSHSLKRSLLQLPLRDSKVVKSNLIHGNWPGANETNLETNLGCKLDSYNNPFVDISTTSSNTTNSHNTSNCKSECMHSVSSENFKIAACSSTMHKTTNSNHTKNKLIKPTAAVAAIASTLDDNIEEFKNRTASNGVPGILQVYAAYKTGLAAGTSLKLHVTPRTTAREVVDLVVKQLNMAIALKGQDGPIYSSDELENFCLVAVIGARERCLRDDFKPLQLQNPWKKGRLYVRLKQDVLAALEHNSKHTTYL